MVDKLDDRSVAKRVGYVAERMVYILAAQRVTAELADVLGLRRAALMVDWLDNSMVDEMVGKLVG